MRAAQTDSDDSNDSLDESDSDSDSEPISRHLTPNTSHSPDADEKPAPFFAATPAAWADLVEEQASLPVITFGELDAHTVRKVRMAEPVTVEVVDDDDQDAEQPVASSSRHSPAPPPPFARRPNNQTARQAYQHRLESDPSFVPVVGEFWGHDDRLLDKDLRSLSGWWRGRWQGRGRGVFPPRGRGRGGFAGGPAGAGQYPPPTAESDPALESPIDRTWTHDGFEEMRRREDTRLRPPQQQPFAPRGGAPLRGSASFRARGGPLGPGRVPGRTWFVMKPEHMWTKHHEAFLYFDPALKPRPGHPPGLRVRLPGGTSVIVRALPRPHRPAKFVRRIPAAENEFVVRLPRAGKERAAPPPLPPANTKPTPPPVPEQDAFVVKLRPARAPSPAPAPAPVLSPRTNPLQPDADGWVRPDPAVIAAVSSPPAGPPPMLHPTPAFYPFAPPPGLGFAFPPPPPHFATHTPQPSFNGHPHTHTPQPSFSHTPPPGFGTPPGGPMPLPPLPPGVALDPRGMPFELATGRPVFLQAPVHYGGFMPGHAHQHSMSIGGHAAHPMSMGLAADPTLFAFARPARVEIRAPGDEGVPREDGDSAEKKAREKAGGNAKLRTGAVAFVPGTPAAPQTEFYGVPAPYDGGYAPPQGGYVPTQYYYPYYPAGPPEQAPQPQAQGTVYY